MVPKTGVFLLLSLILLSPSLTADTVHIPGSSTIHVPGDQPTIQAGIDAAVDGDMVLVADGTYTGEGNRDIEFFGKRITVRSVNGPANCIIDSQASEQDRHRGFHIRYGEDEDTVVEGFTVRGGWCTYDDPGGGLKCENASPLIRDLVITGNSGGHGGGIGIVNGSPIIVGCLITGNTATSGGAGISSEHASPLIIGNTISGNTATLSWGGGAISAYYSELLLDRNIIVDNVARTGGALCLRESVVSASNNEISGNTATDNSGGAVYCDDSCDLAFLNCLIYDNWSDTIGGAVVCFHSTVSFFNCSVVSNTTDREGGAIRCSGSTAIVVDSILWGNSPDEIYLPTGSEDFVSYSDIQGGWAGEGNIDADPLFVPGPFGDHYLSQTAAGQAQESPCVDMGDPEGLVISGSTRTDRFQDDGPVDMGYHHVLDIPGLVVGPGPGSENPPLVRVFRPGLDTALVHEFAAYGAERYGVKVACGNFTRNGLAEVLTGAGPGAIYGPHVRGFALHGEPLPGLSFLAYGTHKWGVNVAAGDIDGDGYDEIITGAGPGAVFGPHVRAWNYDGGPQVVPIPGVSFFAYGTPKWGVNVAAGDLDGDGIDEIVTGAGPGAVYGPHVRGWKVDGGPVTAMPGVSFLAYGTHKFGVNVTCGDVDGDGIDEIITGAGPGPVFAPHVRGWNCDGDTITPLDGLSFFAWNGYRYGATVCAGADLNDDGRAELLVGCGPDPEAGGAVRGFTYDGSTVTSWRSFEAFPQMAGGAIAAAGRF